MKSTSWIRLPLLFLTLVFILQACVEDIGNVTPRADLTFLILDEDNNPVSDARVYLFSSSQAYENYVAANPDGDPALTPSLDPEDVSISDVEGEAFFTNRPLQTTSFPSGDTYLHTPTPIFFRIVATHNGMFVTNDDGAEENHVLVLPELQSGEVIMEFVEVFVQ